jgi:hypothetical protein
MVKFQKDKKEFVYSCLRALFPSLRLNNKPTLFPQATVLFPESTLED